jgi:flagellar biosynthesis protein FliQ
MSTAVAVEMARQTLLTALSIVAPLLAIATMVSLLINIGQVLTSLQESTLSTVPRLSAVATALFLLLPWMARRLAVFTLSVFSDFRPYLR